MTWDSIAQIEVRLHADLGIFIFDECAACSSSRLRRKNALPEHKNLQTSTYATIFVKALGKFKLRGVNHTFWPNAIKQFQGPSRTKMDPKRMTSSIQNKLNSSWWPQETASHLGTYELVHLIQRNQLPLGKLPQLCYQIVTHAENERLYIDLSNMLQNGILEAMKLYWLYVDKCAQTTRTKMLAKCSKLLITE